MKNLSCFQINWMSTTQQGVSRNLLTFVAHSFKNSIQCRAAVPALPTVGHDGFESTARNSEALGCNIEST